MRGKDIRGEWRQGNFVGLGVLSLSHFLGITWAVVYGFK